MKRNSFLTAMLALVLAMSMAVIGCGDKPGGGGGDTSINIATIAGVTAPVQGATPVTTITANNQYTGTIAWHNPENTTFTTFAYDTVYTATITLTAKTGYTLQGVTENFFTVTGATSVTNAANSGVISAVFPQTAEDPSLLHLSGTITINPNTGVTVNTELTATYSGTETVTYQWEKDGSNVGTDSNKYIATEAGSYTVTVSATGYNSKTSDVVTVTEPTTHTVTFNSNGGTTVSPITDIDNGEKITKPADPTKPAYDFNGWYKEAELTNSWNFATDTVTANITLYANWIEKTTFTLGDIGPGGGKIFYVSTGGFTVYQNATDTVGITCHYLEAAPANMPTTLAWASSSYTSADINTAQEIGTGRRNTALILARDANAPAAKACNEYTNNEKSDWFLPSSLEMLQLYMNSGSVGNMGTSTYWSSSQYSTTGSAWTQRFSDGGSAYNAKNLATSVRAVRAF